MRWNRAEGAQARPFPYRLAIPFAAAVAPVLEGVAVVGVTHRLLQETVALYPAALLGASELGPDVGREAVEQVEQRRAVSAGQGSGKGEGLAAGVGQHPGGDALGGATAFILMDLVTDKQVEEALHPVLHVVGQRVATGAGAVGLPEGGAAQVAVAALAGEFFHRQRNPVPVHHLGVTAGAAGDLKGFAGLLVPHQPAPGGGPPLDHGGLPAVGQLGPLPRHHGEEGSGSHGQPEPFQVGDGGDDGGPGAGHGVLNLTLPLSRQVGRAEDQYPPETGGVGGGGADEGLAGAHLTDDGGAPMGLEGEGRAPDGVRLASHRGAQQPGQVDRGFRRPVEGRVGLHHPLGNRFLEGVDES